MDIMAFFKAPNPTHAISVVMVAHNKQELTKLTLKTRHDTTTDAMTGYIHKIDTRMIPP